MQIELTPDEAVFLLDRTRLVAATCRLLDKHRTVTKMVPIYGVHVTVLDALAAKLEKAAAGQTATIAPPNFTTSDCTERDRSTTLTHDWSDAKGG